jgi:hypothetical protein
MLGAISFVLFILGNVLLFYPPPTQQQTCYHASPMLWWGVMTVTGVGWFLFGQIVVVVLVIGVGGPAILVCSPLIPRSLANELDESAQITMFPRARRAGASTSTATCSTHSYRTRKTSNRLLHPFRRLGEIRMGPYTSPIPHSPPSSRSSNVCDLSGKLYRAGSSTESVVSSGSTEITGLWTPLSCKLSDFCLVRADK